MKSSIITTAQAAKILGVSARTAQLWIESGVIPSWKTPGGHRRMYETDVLATLEYGNDIKSPGWDVLVLAPARHHQGWTSAFASMNVAGLTCLDNPVAAAVTLGATVPDMLVVHVDTVDDLMPGFLSSLHEIPLLNRMRIVIATSLPAGEIDALLQPGLNCKVIQLRGMPDSVAGELAKHSPLRSEVPAPLPAALLDAPFPVGPDEPRRLAAVHRSGLLYSAQEEALDNIARIAALTLSMPIALISVISEDKQWFKAKVGLDLAETPRHWAFCNYTLLQTGVQEFSELDGDTRFADNPAVAEAPHFRYYAGAPITDDMGFALGSLCVIDTKPRQLGDDGRQILDRLARQASHEVRRAIRSARRR
ncbi:excisionase family DNA-binding protein [Pseudoduganella lutea]|uniref:Helix-turn-helix domain-containing protein n=1 Tax=Pseudoduganella lutea TaxID=321985 RepID=A0A4P6L3B0_9BURK|nr:excisionase family DNA-binding protein [Pseudoduganella lutea]QBE65884.1 helix-turn-helix domain-containing protein [Pseudoduganella lutea]